MFVVVERCSKRVCGVQFKLRMEIDKLITDSANRFPVVEPEVFLEDRADVRVRLPSSEIVYVLETSGPINAMLKLSKSHIQLCSYTAR